MAAGWQKRVTHLTHLRPISHSFQSHFYRSSIGELGIDIRPRSVDSIPTRLRVIKLSARIYSRWAERKAKKLSPAAHVRGQRVKKGERHKGMSVKKNA